MTDAHRPPHDETPADVTLGGLFRANAELHPDTLALRDPPNRESFTTGPALSLTYAEAAARVQRLAQRLLSFGLPRGSVVALQIPHIVESVIAILAVMRAGLVAAPVPMLWRRSDLVAALSTITPKAMITVARLDDDRPADVMREVAAELFDLSFPCAFGGGLPDGVIPLDEDDLSIAGVMVPDEADARAVSLVTFDTDAAGFYPVGRSDAQWLAAGLATLLEARMEADEHIVTTLPANSLAGIAGAIVPWLLNASTLELAYGPAPAAPRPGAARHLVAPAAVLAPLARVLGGRFASCVAVHRAPQAPSGDLSDVPAHRIVDLYAFGEAGTAAISRESPKKAWPIPVGGLSAPSGAPGAPVVIETRVQDGELWLRGPMVPVKPFGQGEAAQRMRLSADGYAQTGFRCRSDGNGGLLIECGPDRVVAVGGLRFGLDDLRSRFSGVSDGLTVSAVADSLLGSRLRIEASNPETAVAALKAAGHSRLVIDSTVAVKSSLAV